MIYNSLVSTSDRQDTGNDLLNQILSQVQILSGGASEADEVSVLNQILTALASLATASKQDSEITQLQSILTKLNDLATASGQTSANTTLASILSVLSGASTSAKQDIANASLASIDSKLGSSTGTITQQAQSTSSQVLLPANAGRKGFYLYNNSGQKIFVAFAATASSSAFTLLVAANSGYESSQNACYKGIISGVFGGSGGGNVQITEMT